MITSELIEAYYERFNSHDVEGLLSLLDEQIVHEISHGKCEVGKDTVRKFLVHLNECYRERAYDIVVMVSLDGRRAAAEFWLDGEYLRSDGNLPPAQGQTYRLRVGAFFEVDQQKITRISTHYNRKDWLGQIGVVPQV